MTHAKLLKPHYYSLLKFERPSTKLHETASYACAQYLWPTESYPYMYMYMTLGCFRQVQLATCLDRAFATGILVCSLYKPLL